MNKLVIVGNGFDLAHGLPTSYRHFIDDFWKNLKENSGGKMVEVDSSENWNQFLHDDFRNFEEFEKNFENYANHPIFPIHYAKGTLKARAKNDVTRIIFEFKNQFFKKINTRNTIENWVDIENEYYQSLKSIVQDSSLNEIGRKQNVKKLNREFEEIEELLKSYLVKNVNDKYNFSFGRILKFEKLLRFLEIKPKYLNKTNAEHEFLDEFPRADRPGIIDFDNEVVSAIEKDDFKNFLENAMYKNVFLNFNYTDSLYSYVKIIDSKSYGDYLPSEIIPIHGSLKAHGDYDINFGFGDEMDDDYRKIENLDENEYLRNFKSFKYSNNRFYKKLLDLIDSEKFQVFIMGHSCGLSDRTLLNTIFEHDNCRSIKVFYHQREDGSDNFTEIVQNISRHFNDKKLMRSKIVNKSLCKPLPQDIRFQKKS